MRWLMGCLRNRSVSQAHTVGAIAGVRRGSRDAFFAYKKAASARQFGCANSAMVEYTLTKDNVRAPRAAHLRIVQHLQTIVGH